MNENTKAEKLTEDELRSELDPYLNLELEMDDWSLALCNEIVRRGLLINPGFSN